MEIPQEWHIIMILYVACFYTFALFMPLIEGWNEERKVKQNDPKEI